jgi:hypothetical protein|tara:strand:+ start:4258 stop:4716 length:459 start_codon:yes stop_codon:yes gene_type:complete
MDSLSNCNRCGSDACYVDETNIDIKTYFCYGCGFQTHSLMKEDEEFFKEQSSTLPELYKDLLWTDKESGMVWMPSQINVLEQGMVFANGAEALDWRWSAVKAVPVLEEEKEKFPIPNKEGEYYNWRMDMETMKHFEEREYMEALSYIGILPE